MAFSTDLKSSNALTLGSRSGCAIIGRRPSLLTKICYPTSGLATQRNLHSATQGELVVRYSTTQHRALSMVRPSTWNNLLLYFCVLLAYCLHQKCYDQWTFCPFFLFSLFLSPLLSLSVILPFCTSLSVTVWGISK